MPTDGGDRRYGDLLRTAVEQEAWDITDLAAMWEHQLSSRLDFRQLASDVGVARLESDAEVSDPPIRVFRDLLFHPAPPIELLKLTKRLAKQFRRSAPDGFPAELPPLLYYAAIAAALVRCGVRITSQSDADLIHGLKWAISLEWIDTSVRELLTDARMTVVEHDGS